MLTSRALVLGVLMTVFPTAVFAGGELIGDVPVAADLTPAQESQIARIEKLPTTANVTIVTINADALRPAEGDVTVSLDGQAPVIFPEASHRVQGDLDPGGSFIWSAMVDAGADLSNAAATISVTQGEVTATIRTSTRIFRIEPLGGGLSALIEVNADAFPEEHPEEPVQSPEGADVNPADLSKLRPEGDVSVARISVLIVATPEAVANIPNLQSYADLAIAVSNDAFQNSGVNASYELAGVATAVGYTEAGSHHGDLERLASKTDGFLDDVHTLRQQTKADLVVLLTDDGSFCGLARRIFASASTAFATVYWSCGIDNLSIPHELGHLLGACHNTEVSSGCSPFAYGHGFANPTKRVRTIMAYPCSGGVSCVRMPQWSRPPNWGDATRRNDARVLEETSPRAAGFR
jgi:peptidyl-Asp metalloendopeptidase